MKLHLHPNLVSTSAHCGHGFEVAGHGTDLHLPQLKASRLFGVQGEHCQVIKAAAQESKCFHIQRLSNYFNNTASSARIKKAAANQGLPPLLIAPGRCPGLNYCA